MDLKLAISVDRTQSQQPKQKHVNVCGIQYEGSNSYCETHVSKIEAVSQTFACVKTSGTW